MDRLEILSFFYHFHLGIEFSLVYFPWFTILIAGATPSTRVWTTRASPPPGRRTWTWSPAPTGSSTPAGTPTPSARGSASCAGPASSTGDGDDGYSDDDMMIYDSDGYDQVKMKMVKMVMLM